MRLRKNKTDAYQFLFLIKQNESYEQLKKISLEYGTFMKKHNGKKLFFQFLGKRHLNYEIKDDLIGNFLQIQVEINPSFIKAFKNEIKFDERISRVMILNSNQK